VSATQALRSHANDTHHQVIDSQKLCELTMLSLQLFKSDPEASVRGTFRAHCIALANNGLPRHRVTKLYHARYKTRHHIYHFVPQASHELCGACGRISAAVCENRAAPQPPLGRSLLHRTQRRF